MDQDGVNFVEGGESVLGGRLWWWWGKAGEAREAWCPRERTRIDWSRVEA